ncbi:armadillo-type protein [Delphinella strobiligena]|nr:armadillo-type protein [Delphinella strobiligena]
MKSLQSARFLSLKDTQYPDGFKSPNPALNQSGKRAGKEYDMDFLLQFQNIFKEKPSLDWDTKVKETLGDGEPASARQGSNRGGAQMGGRQASRGAGNNAFTAMGSFANQGGARTLPAGTTSQDRFAASQQQRGAIPSGMGGFAGGRGGFPVGNMSRTASLQNMAPGSPKVGGSSRRGGGGGGSRRGASNRHDDRRDADASKNMPLTAGMDLKPLEKSQTGWTPRSLTGGAVQQDTSGQMAPDMVQRKVKAALNKMTPENFDRISDQIMQISDQSKNEKDGRTLRQVIQLTFEKACDEAHWAGTYAKFCSKMLHSMSPEIIDETIRDKNNNPVVGGGLFRKYLLNRCQEEFERGWEANLPDKPEGSNQEAALLSDEYYIAAAAKRRGLGLIQFIGELYKLGMLTVKIMHQCVLRLLNFEGQPDEAAVENLSKLLKAVGATMDSSEQGHQLVDMYYQRVQTVLDTHKDMPSRSRFMLMDIVDLRKQNWKSRDSDKGPKTIEQIHAEAEAAQAAAELERAKNSSRGGGGRPQMGRGDARGFGHQNMPPPDYSRNTVGMDDLRRLQNRGASRQASSGMGPLGPGGFMASRSSSGRKGLGPPRDGESSGPSSRSGTPLNQKKEETNTHVNAFSALAALDGSGESAEASARSEAGSPPVAKAQPASIDAAADVPNKA